MRQIGTIEGEERARRFSDLLTVEGIEHQLDADGDGDFSVWVHDEDRLASAGELLERWRADPSLSDSPGLAAKARALRKKEEKEREAARKRAEQSRRARFATPRGLAPVTGTLIGISIVVGVLTRLGDNHEVLRWLTFTDYRIQGEQVVWTPGFQDILSGQVWRLITPIFIHFGILHIFFNMWWMKDLGTAIERHHGLRIYVPLLVLTAILPNLAEAVFSNFYPLSGGMSGVVYGLLGYIWMRGKFDPLSGLHLPPQIVTFMLLWFFMGVFGVIPHIANWAHGAGLGVGMAYGYFLARVFPSHRLR